MRETKSLPVIAISDHSYLQGQSTWETSLKIKEADPFRCNRDSHHVLNHGSNLRHPSFSLLLSEIALRSQRILRNNSIDGLQPGSTTHQQHLVWEGVVINRERHLRVFRQSLKLRRFRRRTRSLIPSRQWPPSWALWCWHWSASVCCCFLFTTSRRPSASITSSTESRQKRRR